MFRLAIVALFVTAWDVSPATAQATALYTRAPSDTLWYREITHADVTMESRQRTVTVRTEHDALVALAFGAHDSAWAWYDSLRLRSVGPGGEAQPNTNAVLGQRFSMLFASRGALTTLTTPAFTPEITAITDLRRQFDDFMIRLPPEGPFQVGRAWADTLRQLGGGPLNDTYESRRVFRYRIVGDTTVNGVSMTQILVSQDVTIEASSFVEAQQLTIETRLSGSEQGEVLFDVGRGFLMHRAKHGELRGTMTAIGGSSPVTLSQVWQYSSTIDLVRRRGA